MKVHEHQAKAILREFGVPVPDGDVANTAAQARDIAARPAPVGGTAPWPAPEPGNIF